MLSSVLIFGGTFDPPHRAHALLPPQVAKLLGCGRILYIPAAANPLKADHRPTPAEHRLAMLRLALREVPQAEISTIELDRAASGDAGPSFTIDTLEALRRELGPGVHLRLLIGADQALEFHRWKDWRRILELATPAVMLRPPWDEAAFATALAENYTPEQSASWLSRVVHVPVMDVSATTIRDRIAGGQGLDDLLHPHVASYIRAHRLYQ